MSLSNHYKEDFDYLLLNQPVPSNALLENDNHVSYTRSSCASAQCFTWTQPLNFIVDEDWKQWNKLIWDCKNPSHVLKKFKNACNICPEASSICFCDDSVVTYCDETDGCNPIKYALTATDEMSDIHLYTDFFEKNTKIRYYAKKAFSFSADLVYKYKVSGEEFTIDYTIPNLSNLNNDGFEAAIAWHTKKDSLIPAKDLGFFIPDVFSVGKWDHVIKNATPLISSIDATKEYQNGILYKNHKQYLENFDISLRKNTFCGMGSAFDCEFSPYNKTDLRVFSDENKKECEFSNFQAVWSLETDTSIVLDGIAQDTITLTIQNEQAVTIGTYIITIGENVKEKLEEYLGMEVTITQDSIGQVIIKLYGNNYKALSTGTYFPIVSGGFFSVCMAGGSQIGPGILKSVVHDWNSDIFNNEYFIMKNYYLLYDFTIFDKRNETGILYVKDINKKYEYFFSRVLSGNNFFNLYSETSSFFADITSHNVKSCQVFYDNILIQTPDQFAIYQLYFDAETGNISVTPDTSFYFTASSCANWLDVEEKKLYVSYANGIDLKLFSYDLMNNKIYYSDDIFSISAFDLRSMSLSYNDVTRNLYCFAVGTSAGTDEILASISYEKQGNYFEMSTAQAITGLPDLNTKEILESRVYGNDEKFLVLEDQGHARHRIHLIKY